MLVEAPECTADAPPDRAIDVRVSGQRASVNYEEKSMSVRLPGYAVLVVVLPVLHGCASDPSRYDPPPGYPAGLPKISLTFRNSPEPGGVRV